MEWIEEQLCAIQAQLRMQRVALRALARSHPDPGGLLRAWRQALQEDATTDPVAPSSSRHSQSLEDLAQGFAEHWTAELVDLVVPTVPGKEPGEAAQGAAGTISGVQQPPD